MIRRGVADMWLGRTIKRIRNLVVDRIRLHASPENEEENIDREKMLRTVEPIVAMLVDGEYEALAALSDGRLSAEEIREGVEEWPFALKIPPIGKLPELITCYDISDGLSLLWELEVELWDTEGSSDLYLIFRLTDTPGERYDVVLRDLDVL